LERVWFDYCCVHVSTVISHVSQQFRFLVFFIVTLNCFQLSFALNTVLSHVHINVASQTSVIGYVKRAHFIHDSITLTSSEFDVSSDGPLKLTQCRSSLFTLRQLSSAGARIDL
ncbi:hypothetical protein T03_16082, partial [Trichinella britovi]